MSRSYRIADSSLAREPIRTGERRITMGRRHDTSRNHRTARIVAAAVAVAGLGLSACSGADDDDAAASEDTADALAAPAPAATAEDDSGAAESGTEDAGDDGASTDRGVDIGGSGFDLGAIGRDVIIEMRVAMSSDDIQRTVSSITADAAALGGGIASSDVSFGTSNGDTGEQVDGGYAILVVKVPPESIDRMLTRLGDAGEVDSISQSAQDVTEQLVDLDVRIRNARRSVESVRAFMDRTENLSELVSLESELTRRQTDLERLEAQQRNLSERVALSTITVEVRPTADPPTVGDGDDSIGDAFRTGWDAFVAALFTFGFVVAVLAPFLVVAIVIALGVWLVRRRPLDADQAPLADREEPSVDEQEPTPV
jgi:hypothetical protein